MHELLLAQWRTAARRDIVVSEGTPLDYTYGGSPWRFAIYDSVPAEDRKGTYFGEDGLVAFLDAFVWGDQVFIAYMRTRDGHGGRGHARRLVQAVYDRWPDKRIDWGKVMDPKAGKLWEWFREHHHPERGNYGKNWYGR